MHGLSRLSLGTWTISKPSQSLPNQVSPQVSPQVEKGSLRDPRQPRDCALATGAGQPSAPGTVLPRSSERLAGRVAPCWCAGGTVSLVCAERASFRALGPPEPSAVKGFPWIRKPSCTDNCHENLGMTLLASGCWDRCHCSPFPGMAFCPSDALDQGWRTQTFAGPGGNVREGWARCGQQSGGSGEVQGALPVYRGQLAAQHQLVLPWGYAGSGLPDLQIF